VDVTCLNCSAAVAVSPSACWQISQFDPDASELNPAARIIMESSTSGCLLLHRCLIDVLSTQRPDARQSVAMQLRRGHLPSPQTSGGSLPIARTRDGNTANKLGRLYGPIGSRRRVDRHKPLDAAACDGAPFRSRIVEPPTQDSGGLGNVERVGR
jgi:hypothetical protein